jgi:TonB family protein
MKAEISEALRTPEPELHLVLLDQEMIEKRPNFLRAGTGSILVHVVIVLLLIGIAQLPAPEPLPQKAIDDLRKAVSLVAPQLTQKEPNRAKVAKEVTVENLTAKPDIRPTPQKRFIAPPPPPRQSVKPPAPTIDPPSIRVAQSPPPTLGTSPTAPPFTPQPPPPPAQEKPKLAFETPGSSGTATGPVTGTGRIPVPKSGLEDAVRGAIRSGGGGTTVGDNTDEPSPRSELNPQNSVGRPKSSLELLSDPMGVDFKPYLIRILTAVRRNWFAVIPESARLGGRGRTVLQFSISTDGRVPKLVIVTPSGLESMDRAAVAGVSASNPFPPLPPEYKGREIRVQFVFSYNLSR